MIPFCEFYFESYFRHLEIGRTRSKHLSGSDQVSPPGEQVAGLPGVGSTGAWLQIDHPVPSFSRRIESPQPLIEVREDTCGTDIVRLEKLGSFEPVHRLLEPTPVELGVSHG